MADYMEFKTPNQKPIEEQFLIVVLDLATYYQFYLLVPGRKEFAKLLNLLSPQKYLIAQVHLLSNVKKYDEFIKELKDEAKPDGLNFG